MPIPDQTGRTVVVTGANTGIGFETAGALAEAGATTVITSRDPAKGEAALSALKERTGGDVHLVLLDLASLASVRAAAAEILQRFDRLDVLVNNAGLLLSARRVTEDGFEMTIGVNHLGPFLLTQLLLDRIRASAPARIVNVASIAHTGARAGVGFDDLQSEQAYSGLSVYSRSKLANILFTRELARRLDGTGVTAFAVHPGGVRSGFGLDGDTRGIVSFGIKLLDRTPVYISSAKGAGASLHAATTPGIEDRSGAYFARKLFGNFGQVVEAKPALQARDDEAARRLWETSEDLIASVTT
jgi:NAD(P)-dependent dehydrogenase (short-subunit alcohol dehydrogenase family)